MSLREEASSFARSVVRDALNGYWAARERRLDMEWAKADIFALEAERMIFLLQTDSGRVFARRIRIVYWRNRRRKFSAIAWAKDPEFVKICEICRPNSVAG